MSSMMHPNQIPTSPDLVRSLLRRQYPTLANEPIAPTPYNGTDNAVYRVGNHHSVRLPIIDWSKDNEARIRPWLPWMRDRLEIAVPVPVHYGHPDCGYPYHWTIYPWLAGANVAMGCGDTVVATEIAAFLNELRALPGEGAPASGRSPHALDDDVRACLRQLLPQDEPAQLTAIWDEMMSTPAWDGTGAVWLHGDIAPGNLLFANGRLVAAIDWAGVGVGDPASDLQVAWNMLVEPARQAFRAAMGVDDQIWERARARAFAQASFQLPYYRETLPLLGNQASHVFREIRAEYGYSVYADSTQ